MKKIFDIKTVGEYDSLTGQETLHPLVSIVDFSKAGTAKNKGIQFLKFGFYSVFLKDDSSCIIRYGRKKYDYQKGTLVFIAPGQEISIEEDGEDYQPHGYALLFHPDLIRGTSLGNNMKDFSFFSYHIHEALHLSEQENQIVLECFRKVEYELKHAVDKHSKKLITHNIELFLNYCVRFYDRQFITRNHALTSVLEKFENQLTDYFDSDKPQSVGMPNVAFFASQFNLSTNYFGDLKKKESGKSALEYIQLKMIEIAKEKIFDTSKSINEVAIELGFKYPQYFSRFFKQHVGHTPNEYRHLN
jgi:AraC family transcriptional regulator, transcriptional activator of pobA